MLFPRSGILAASECGNGEVVTADQKKHPEACRLQGGWETVRRSRKVRRVKISGKLTGETSLRDITRAPFHDMKTHVFRFA